MVYIIIVEKFYFVSGYCRCHEDVHFIKYSKSALDFCHSTYIKKCQCIEQRRRQLSESKYEGLHSRLDCFNAWKGFMLTVLDKELALEKKSFFDNLVSLCSKMYGDNKELRCSIQRMRKEGNDRSVSIMCRSIRGRTKLSGSHRY